MSTISQNTLASFHRSLLQWYGRHAGKKVAVMEANVKRVLSRIFALKNPAPDELWEKAAALLDKRHAFDYNQAMMDLGATLCKKREPGCPLCPAQAICKGRSSPHSYP